MSDMEIALIIAVAIIIKIAIVVGGGMIARSKGRSFVGWALACLFFNWIALLIIILLPKVSTAADVAAHVKVLTVNDMSKVDLNGSTTYQTANGVVVSRLKDGRALAKLSSELKLFDSIEDYRVWSNDQSSWQEIKGTV